MLPINIALVYEQEKNASLEAEGRFDGICGLPPTKPQDYIYWDGYQVELREYWSKKLNVEIPTEF